MAGGPKSPAIVVLPHLTMLTNICGVKSPSTHWAVFQPQCDVLGHRYPELTSPDIGWKSCSVPEVAV